MTALAGATTLHITAAKLEATAREVHAAAESMVRIGSTREVALVLAGALVEDLGISHEQSLRVATRMANRVLGYIGGTALDAGGDS